MIIMEIVPSRRNCCIFMNDRIQHVEVEIGGWCGAVLENDDGRQRFFLGLFMCGAPKMFATRMWQTQLFSLLSMVRTNTTRDNLFYNEELQAELKVWQIRIATVETALMRGVKRSRNC